MDPISIATTLARTFAPNLIRRFVGDGAADAASQFLGMAEQVTGTNDPEAIARELNQNAALLHQFQTQAAELDNAIDLALIADRQDARERDLAMMAAGVKNWRGDILAFTAIAGLIAALAFAFFVPIESGPARDLILILGGALITIVKDVYGFEFGSSRGSKDKADRLSRISRDD